MTGLNFFWGGGAEYAFQFSIQIIVLPVKLLKGNGFTYDLPRPHANPSQW
jgi:hypothetical protein